MWTGGVPGGPADVVTVMCQTQSSGGQAGGSAEGGGRSPRGALSVLVVHAVFCIPAVAPL